MTDVTQPGVPAPNIHLAGRRDQAPMRVKSVHMQVREQLTRDIVSGVLAPGQRLTQADLASRFGVSVAPIREALRELNNEGLVELDPFTGMTVHRPTLESLENVYEVRMALEPLTIPHERVKLPDDVVADAAALIEVMDRNLDRASWTAANKEFHRLLRSRCTNALVLELLHRLENLFDVYVSLSMINRADANDEHRKLLEAYRRGRRTEILGLTRDHIRGTFDACRVVLTDPADLGAEPQQRAADRA
jgi:DNA-binding GntR family transcriptional regulator